MHEGLAKLAQEYWDFMMESNPTWAIILGDHRFDDQLEDMSREHEDEQIAKLDRFTEAAVAINPDICAADDRITRDVLVSEAHGMAEELRSRMAELNVNHTMGIHVQLLQAVGQFPITEPEHADAVIGKFSKMPKLFEQSVHRLRQGVALDRTPPRVAVERTIEQLDEYVASDIDSDPYVNLRSPGAFTKEAEADWRDRLKKVVTDSVRPAYLAYRNALADEILEKSRPEERTGVRWLPDGEEVYDRAIKRYTSLSLPALEIHQIGLNEIEQLGDEYRQLGSSVLGTTDLAEIYTRLRDDRDLRFETAEQVREAGADAMARAKAEIPNWFGRLPEADCVMAEIPGAGAKDAPLAFYLPPAADGSRPGTFFVNTTEPSTRTKYESEALTFHESIPGHHLQLAIAQELDGLPDFRKHALVTVYVEGWGLYTERLADEMGLYSNDLARMGILSFDSWRAGRLVVDTGIHALGWSRQEAIDFLAENSPQAPNNIANEVDRYIGWPGQALAYKIGQREIFRLREDAKTKMGERFDIKGFHDTVLSSGPVPLDTLASLVNAWAAT